MHKLIDNLTFTMKNLHFLLTYPVHWTKVCHARNEEHDFENAVTFRIATDAWLFANFGSRFDSQTDEWNSTHFERPKILDVLMEIVGLFRLNE